MAKEKKPSGKKPSEKKTSGKKMTKAAAKAALSRQVDSPGCRFHPLGFWYEDEGREPARPTSFSSMIPAIMALYGAGRRLGVERFCEVWSEIYKQAIPRVYEQDRDGDLLQITSFRGGVVRVEVANNLILQEVLFSRQEVIRLFRERLPEEKITDVRFALRRESN
ncbi:MAG: hypothetical protein Q4G59_02145 [Planctomycetia bacterium]|nr:hypothetical protein [Planctomycetia bacterium]